MESTWYDLLFYIQVNKIYKINIFIKIWYQTQTSFIFPNILPLFRQSHLQITMYPNPVMPWFIQNLNHHSSVFIAIKTKWKICLEIKGKKKKKALQQIKQFATKIHCIMAHYPIINILMKEMATLTNFIHNILITFLQQILSNMLLWITSRKKKIQLLVQFRIKNNLPFMIYCKIVMKILWK